METQKIYSQHQENVEWSKKIAFYKDEIKIMQERVAEVASKNSSKDVLAQIEHFQNQIIVQRNNMDEIMHSINICEDELNKNINKNDTAVDHRHVADHSKERENITRFEKVFNDLRKELNIFIAQWL